MIQDHEQLTSANMFDTLLPRGTKIVSNRDLTDLIEQQLGAEIADLYVEFTLRDIIPEGHVRLQLIEFFKNRTDIISQKSYLKLLENHD